MLAVTILGNNSAIPAFGRHPTAQIITTQDDLLLFDCGEGTQIQILNYRIRRSRINHIFISHLHGDHYFGLIGLLNSMALLGRIQPLHVYGPAPLIDILNLQFSVAKTVLPYDFTFHPIIEKGILLESKSYTVECFSTKHRIQCWGFLIKEKKNPRKVNLEEVKKYDVPKSFYHDLQLGHDFKTTDGGTVKNDLLTIPQTKKSRSYAFCADSAYDEDLVEIVSNVDLMYHETTYPHAFAEKATERFHSTTKQAASIAEKAAVKKLLIGHFSAKFETLEIFETEAREVFPNTELATEGVTYLI